MIKSSECISKKVINGSKIKSSLFKAHQPGKSNGLDLNSVPSLLLALSILRSEYISARRLIREMDKNNSGG